MSLRTTNNGIPIVDSTTDLRTLGKSLRESAGYERRDYKAEPVGGGPYAKAWAGPRLSKAERIERIKERERTQSRTIDLMNHYGIVPYHQGQTSTCWAQSTTFAFDLTHAKQQDVAQQFSPASVAARITGFRDQGGWCSKALDKMCTDGIATAKNWSPNAVTNRSLDNAVTQAERQLYKPTEFDDFTPGDIDAVIDYILLQGLPVAVAAMWMQHAVTWIDPYVARDGSIGIVAANSGYLRDANGFTAFEGRRLQFDEAVAIRVVTA